MYDGINLGGGNLTWVGFFFALSGVPEVFATAILSLASEELLFLFLCEESDPNNVFAAVLVARTSKPSLNA